MRSLIVLLLLAHAGTATAHHAFAADYEAGNEGVIEGTITEVIYKNPHARYYIEVEAGEGGTELWDLQTMNLMMLGRVGWTRDTLQVGDRIKVEGILGRNNTRRMSINVVTTEDGRVISPQRGITETNADLYTRGSASRAPTMDRDFESIASDISPGTYELDENHGYLSFSYSHLGLSNPELQFGDFSAILALDSQNLADSRVTISIDAESVSGVSPALDEVLRSEDFFDTANHPEIVFTSTGYEERSANTGRLTGDLSVAGVVKPVTLDVVINKAAMDQRNRREMIGFSATGTLSRAEFGMTQFEQLVADELALNVQVEFQKVR